MQNQDKLQKARKIIAKLLANRIFTDWENRTQSDLLSLLSKLDGELSLGINPSAVLDTMVREGIVHENGTYNSESIYSLKKAKEKVTL